MTERQEEQAALSALHALDPHERQILRAEMRTDPRLRDLVAELEDAAARIVLLLPAEAPPEEVKPLLLKTLKQRRREKATPVVGASFRFLLGPRIAWAAAACLAVIVWSGRSARRHLSEQSATLSQSESEARGEAAAATEKLAGLEKDLVEATARADRLAGEIASLRQASPSARMEVTILRATLRRFEEGAAVIIWDGEKQEGRLRLERLPPAQANKDYQLWVIDKKTSMPVSAGAIKVDARGTASVTFKPAQPVPGAVRFAISIETLGSAARKPEGLVIFAGP